MNMSFQNMNFYIWSVGNVNLVNIIKQNILLSVQIDLSANVFSQIYGLENYMPFVFLKGFYLKF